MIILSFLFLLTATLYSSVGFGGGSTYLALLLIWDVPYLIFPVIALFCNIIVVSGNCINYIKAGNFNLKILTPYLILSVPLAFVGGSISIEKNFFEVLLFIILTLAGIMLLLKFKSFDEKIEVYKKKKKVSGENSFSLPSLFTGKRLYYDISSILKTPLIYTRMLVQR